MGEYLQDLHLQDDETAFITDSRGMIIAHPMFTHVIRGHVYNPSERNGLVKVLNVGLVYTAQSMLPMTISALPLKSNGGRYPP